MQRQASEQAYHAQPKLAEPLASWSYDDYTKVSFRADRATWFNQGLPYWLESFHRGFVQVDQVELFTLTPVSGGNAICERIRFSKQDFQYQQPLQVETIPAAGHAGLKVVSQFPGRSDAEEVLSFLGSSYFRARSGDTIYGASARGLAIDVGMNRDEEFLTFARSGFGCLPATRRNWSSWLSWRAQVLQELIDFA